MAEGGIGKEHLDNNGMYSAHSIVVSSLSLMQPSGNGGSGKWAIKFGASGGGAVGHGVAMCLIGGAFAVDDVLLSGMPLDLGCPDGLRGFSSDAAVQ